MLLGYKIKSMHLVSGNLIGELGWQDCYDKEKNIWLPLFMFLIRAILLST